MSATETFLQSLQQKSGARVSTMLTLDPRTPEDAAEAMRVGGELGLPANVVSTDPAGFKRQLEQKKNTTALTGAPKTAKWLEDLNNGVLAKGDVENLSWFEKNGVQSPGALTRAAARGIVRMGAIPGETTARIAGQRLQDYGKDFDTIYAEELAKIGGENAPAAMRVTAMQVAQERANRVEGMTEEDRADVLQRGATALSEARDVLDRAADIPMNETATRFRDETLSVAENTFLGTLKAFASDPEGGISFIAQTAAEVLPILAASTATTAVTRSPVAGIGVMSGGSFLIENTNSAMELLAERGVDLSTPEAAAAVLGNAELMREAADRGLTRGLVIAMFDAASGGVAGQTLMKSPMGEVVAQGMAQVLLGGAGEAAGQAASGQDINWQEIVIEGLAELVTAPVEVGGVAGRGFLSNLSKSTESGTTASEIDQIDAMVAKSKLKQLSPDKFAEALDAQGESDFFVGADDLREYFQAKDVELDAETLQAWGIDPEDFARAESSGGDVTVSRSTYAARISGGEDAAWFRDNATRESDEMSVSQSARFNSEVRETMEKAFADAEAQRKDDLEVRASDVKVYDSVFTQLREAGRTRDVADNEARVWSSFWRTMGERYGADPMDLAQSMGVNIRGPQTPEVSRRRNDLDIKLNTLRSNPKKALKPAGSDLLDFVRSQGGISDVGGDIQAMDAPKGVIAETRDQYEARRGQPSLTGDVAPGRGKGLDEIGRAAIEAGYFPELMGGADIQADGTVVDEAAVILEALQRAIAGEAIYAEGQGPDADMTALSEQISQLGLDISAMSNDEIVAALDRTDGQQYDQSGQLITDTPEFKAWFGDSKVVDADGKPLVVYHGSVDWVGDDFAFDPAMIGEATDAGTTGRGFYFARRRGDAEDFAYGWTGYDPNQEQTKVAEVYLAIENPLVLPNVPSVSLGGKQFKFQDMMDDPALSVEFTDALRAEGYDGVISSETGKASGADQFMVLDPTQIKSVHNRGAFDVNDPRILYQRDEQENPLVVVHNISERGLLIADELGGLAAPSLAVAGGDVGFDNFGDITLIASKDLADPKARGVRTFASDVYSARQPRARYDLKKSGLDRIESVLGPAAKKIGLDSIWQEISEDRMASGIEDAMENSDAVKMAFLESIGKAPRVVKQKKPEFDPRLKPFAKADVSTLYDNPEFDALALEMAEERIAGVSNEKFRDRVENALIVVEDGKRLPSYDMINDLAKRIEKNRAPEGIDRYETGKAIRDRINQTKKRRGEFEAWIKNEFGDVLTNKHFETETGRRKPYEMAPLVREITRSLRDAEGYNYGSGSVRALVTPEFKSIDAIKARRGKIISDEEMKALGDEANNDLFALAEKFAGYHSSGQDFGWGDIFSEFLKDLARGNLREWQSSIFSEPVPDNLIVEARAFLGKLADMPTHYFEVKMQRAVALDEFAAALVPKSASTTTVEILKAAGLRVVRYEKNNTQSRLDALKKAGGREFFQTENASKRGSITLPSGGLQDGKTVINLFESADLSTFLHESGHFFLEAFTALATSDTAPQAMKDDLAAIHKFLKVDGTAPLETAQHEMWARGFEAYLMEGKAPSLELADAFGRFKAWLTRIYRSISGLNVKLTPEIREVMDRMLATDAEIQAAREEQQMSPMFTDETASGMSPAAWQTYQKMTRRSEEQASQSLLEKTMAKVRREKEKWWKQERADVKKEVTSTVNSQREYRLIELMANQRWIGGEEDVPDFRLDRKALVEAFGDGILPELSKNKLGGKRAIYGDDGVSLYEAADFFGFANPTEMVETLQNTGKRQDAIELETDRIMSERYGDPLNDGTIEEEALAAIHTEQQAQTLATEVRHLSGQAGRSTRNLTPKVFRQRARMMISRMSVKDATRPDAFLAAERKAAKRAEDAFAKVVRGRDAGAALATAAKHKEQQLLNHYLYLESRDLTKMVASKREKMRNYSKKSVREKLDGGYIEQIDAILDGYDFRVRSAGQVAQSESLRAFVDRMIEDGREGELAIDPRLVEEANRKHYSRLSVDELRGLFDTIDNIDHMGRFKQKLRDAKQTRDLQEVADTFVGSIKNRFGSGKAAKQSKQVRNFFNLLFSVDTMMVDLDGTEVGDVYDLFKAPLDRGQALEQKMNVEMADAVQHVFSAYTSKELAEMQVQKAVPGGNGHLWSKMEIIALALNTGNQDGRNRILEDTVHPERRLTQDQLDATLDTLEKADWDFVQSMIEQVNSYWPELSATHKRRTNTELKKVSAMPIETKFGTYPGGYYPISFDSQRSIGAAKDEASAWDKFQAAGRGSRIEVKSGMTKARQQNSGGRTVDFDLNVALRHMRDTIRVIAMSEVVDNAARIIKHKDVETAFMDAGQTHMFNVLKLFLDDLAMGPVYNTDPINSFARIVKNNFTMAKLAFNFKTVALQATGIAQSAVVVGKRNMVRGYRDYLANPNAGVQLAMEKSDFMAERKSSFQKDIYDQVNDIQLSSPLAKRATKVKNVIGKAGFYPMIRVQFLTVDVPTWIAAYDSKMREANNEDAAIRYADRIVARSQGSGLYGDRNAMERGTVSQNTRQSDFIRLWTTLGSYMVTKMNRGYLAAQKGRRDISGAQNVGEMTGAALNMAADLTLLYMAEAIMMGLAYALLAGDDADEDDLIEFVMTNTATSVIGGVPIVSGVANAFQGYGAGGVLASVLEMPANVTKQLSQGENDAALWRSIADAGGMLTGMPSTSAFRAIEGVVRYNEDGDVPISDMLFGTNPLTR